MALRTAQQYVEDLRRQRRTMYAFGEKIGDDWLEHPYIKPALNCMKQTYELALLPEYEDLMTTKSHLTGEKINRFNSILFNTTDYAKRFQGAREAMSSHGGCNAPRCTASETLNTLYNVTYVMDQELGTHYHEKFLELVKEVHSKDSAVSVVMTDTKGDRSKRPTQQDPDMYVHVAERKDGGIILRGGKVHQSLMMLSDYYIVCPTVLVREDEKDYAIVCAVPTDTEGIVHILQSPSSDYKRLYEDLDIDLGNAKYGIHTTSMMIFNDVFVPWERVFMCGEYQFIPGLLSDFGRHQRIVCADCKATVAELMAGAGATIAEYNGLDWRRVAHLRDKIMDIIQKASLVRGCVMGAIAQSETSPSGVLLPDVLFVGAARLYATDLIFDSARNLMDIAGSLISTLPSERDLRNPETKGYMEKYLKGREDVSVENRMRMFRFIEYISGLAGGIMPACLHAGGSPEVRKLDIRMRANVEGMMKRAKELAGIKEG